MEITIKIDGADAVEKFLESIADRAGNMSPIMKAIGDRVVEQTKRRFEKGGPAPGGTPWAKVKKPHPKARGILRITDQLKDSIRYQMIGNDSVAIGSNKVYAAIHQLGGEIRQGAKSELFMRKRSKSGKYKKGTTAGRGYTFKDRVIGIPARPFLGLSGRDSNEVLGLINEWIVGR